MFHSVDHKSISDVYANMVGGADCATRSTVSMERPVPIRRLVNACLTLLECTVTHVVIGKGTLAQMESNLLKAGPSAVQE